MCGWDWGTDIFLLFHFHSFKFKQPQVASGYLIDQGRAQRFSPCLVRTCSPGWFCRTLRSSVTSACSLWFWHWAHSQLCTFHLSLCGWLASLFPSSHKCWPSHPSELNQPLAQPGIASSDPLHPGAQHTAPRGTSQTFFRVWLRDAGQTHSAAPHLPLLPPTSPPGGFPTTSWCPADSTVHMTPKTVLLALPQSCCSAHIHLCWKESHLRAAWDLEADKSWPAIPPGFSPTVIIPNICVPQATRMPLFQYFFIGIFKYLFIGIFQ